MSRRTLSYLAVLLLTLAGCGGGGGNGSLGDPGEISGVILDALGEPVRDARVYVENPDRETVSNSAGAYVLEDVAARDVTVRAEVTQDGLRYVGQNLARVFEFERARSVNIAVYRDNRLATLRGTVRTQSGNRISGARVFAVTNDQLSSAMAITDSSGNFVLRRLPAEMDLLVSANAPEFRSDDFVVNLDPGEDRTVEFILSDGLGVPEISPPSNVEAVAWTSPQEATRSTDSAMYEAIKQAIDPRRAQAMQRLQTRGVAGTSLVEVDVFWDPINLTTLLGYGIYRAQGASGVLEPSDFLRDPLAIFFADADPLLVPGAIYSYAVNAINSDSEEGPLSPRSVVETLGELQALNPTFGPLRFHWLPAAGAEEYIVYVFDEEPRLGVTSIWNNEGAPTAGTSLLGPNLSSGQRYWFVVLGVANGFGSRSISRVETFIATN